MEQPVFAIVNHCHPAWYCHKCKVPHNILYVKGNEHYCPTCVPEEIKFSAIPINQNGVPVPLPTP